MQKLVNPNDSAPTAEDLEAGRDLLAMVVLGVGTDSASCLTALKRWARTQPPADGYAIALLHLDTSRSHGSKAGDPTVGLSAAECLTVGERLDGATLLSNLGTQPHLKDAAAKLGTKRGALVQTAQGSHFPEVARLKAEYDLPKILRRLEETYGQAEGLKQNTRRRGTPRLGVFQVQNSVGGTQGIAPDVHALTDAALSALLVPGGDRWTYSLWIDPDPKLLPETGLRNWWGTRSELLRGLALHGIGLPEPPGMVLPNRGERHATPGVVFCLQAVDAAGDRSLHDHHQVGRVAAKFIHNFSHSTLGPAVRDALFDGAVVPTGNHEDPSMVSFGIQVWRASGGETVDYLASRLGEQYLESFSADVGAVTDSEQDPLRQTIKGLQERVESSVGAAPEQVRASVTTRPAQDPAQRVTEELKSRKPRTRNLHATWSDLVRAFEDQVIGGSKNVAARKSDDFLADRTRRMQAELAALADEGQQFAYLAAALSGVTLGDEQVLQGLRNTLSQQSTQATAQKQSLARRALTLRREVQDLAAKAAEWCDRNRGRAARFLIAQATAKWAECLRLDVEADGFGQTSRVLAGLAAKAQTEGAGLAASAERVDRTLRDSRASGNPYGLGRPQGPVEQKTARNLLTSQDLQALYLEATGFSWAAGLTPGLRKLVEEEVGRPSQWRFLPDHDLLLKVRRGALAAFSGAMIAQQPLDTIGLAGLLRWKLEYRGFSLPDFLRRTMEGAEPMISVVEAAGQGMSRAITEVLVGGPDEELLGAFHAQSTRTFVTEDPNELVVVKLLIGIPFANLSRYSEGKQAFDRDPFTLLCAADEEAWNRLTQTSVPHVPGANGSGEPVHVPGSQG